MSRPPIIAFAGFALGLVVLAGLVTLTPQRTGLPAHRIVEMGLFWIGLSLCVIGAGKCMNAAAASPTPSRADAAPDAIILAAVGLLVALVASALSLTNLLFTTLQGARILDLGMRPTTLYPREVGYAMLAPFLFGGALHVPMLRQVFSSDSVPAAPRRPKALRVVGAVLLAGLFVVFLGTGLISVLDRRFQAASVGVTWVAGLGFVAMACERVIWAVTRGQRAES